MNDPTYKLNSPVTNNRSTARNDGTATTPMASGSPATPSSSKNKALSDMDNYCVRTKILMEQSWLLFMLPNIIHREGNKVNLELAMAYVNYNNFDSKVHNEQELTMLGNPSHLNPSDLIHRREIMEHDMMAVLTPRVKVSMTLQI